MPTETWRCVAPPGGSPRALGTVWLDLAHRSAPGLLPSGFGDYEPVQFRYGLDGPSVFLDQLDLDGDYVSLILVPQRGIVASVDQSADGPLRCSASLRTSASDRGLRATFDRFFSELPGSLAAVAAGAPEPPLGDLLAAWEPTRSPGERADPTAWGASPTVDELVDRLTRDRLYLRVVTAAVRSGPAGDTALARVLGRIGGARGFDIAAGLARTTGEHGTAALREQLAGDPDGRRRRVPAYVVLSSLAARLGEGALPELVAALDQPTWRQTALWGIAAHTSGGAWEPVHDLLGRMLCGPRSGYALGVGDQPEVAGLGSAELAGVLHLLAHADDADRRGRVVEMLHAAWPRLDDAERTSLVLWGVPRPSSPDPLPDGFDVDRPLSVLRALV